MPSSWKRIVGNQWDPGPDMLTFAIFGIKDQINANEITIRHCRTTLILADFFTKPLQRALFTRFCDVILGHKHLNSLDVGPTPKPGECVGREQANGYGTD